jgi:hypothetical protein
MRAHSLTCSAFGRTSEISVSAPRAFPHRRQYLAHRRSLPPLHPFRRQPSASKTTPSETSPPASTSSPCGVNGHAAMSFRHVVDCLSPCRACTPLKSLTMRERRRQRRQSSGTAGRPRHRPCQPEGARVRPERTLARATRGSQGPGPPLCASSRQRPLAPAATRETNGGRN